LAYRDGTNREAREAMSLAALLSGMALANSGLGMAHGVAAALGAICDVPHGLACAVMLPIALQVNLDWVREKFQGLEPAFRNLSSPNKSHDDDGHFSIAAIDNLMDQLQLPRRLREVGVQRDQIPALVAGSRGNSMNGNPRELADEELTRILEEHW
jgi:alcohol dehydrogenase class IV